MGKPGKLLCTVQAFGWLSATGLAFADHSRAPGKLLCTVQAFGWLSATGLAFADHSRAPGKRTGATLKVM
jgi:hypothetical protein